MGQILIIEGEDFSGNPNAVNLAEFPTVTDGLIGFYTGSGSQSDSDGIISMPSIFASGESFTRITGQTRSPVYFTGSTNFKGNVIRSANNDTTTAPGLEQTLNIDFVSGISFTFMMWRSAGTGPSGSTARVVLGIESIALQFRAVTPSGSQHLAIGPTNYDIGFGGQPSRVDAITVVVTKASFKMYLNGELLSTTDISGSNLPDSDITRVTYGSNWNGTSALQQNQTKQIQIHNKELSLSEVEEIHSVLPSLLA